MMDDDGHSNGGNRKRMEDENELSAQSEAQSFLISSLLWILEMMMIACSLAGSGWIGVCLRH